MLSIRRQCLVGGAIFTDGHDYYLTPMIAVTDLVGVSIWLSVQLNPIRRCALRKSRRFFCNSMGKSPYPGLKRYVRFSLDISPKISISARSHTCSIAALQRASATTAPAISETAACRIRLSTLRKGIFRS